MKRMVRGGLILFLCLGTAALVLARLVQRPRFEEPKSFREAAYDAPGFRKIVAGLNTAFETRWAKAGLAPAPPAPDLAVARRLSLALTGTIPSLEEIRAFEAHESGHRVQWWLSHLFEDRRFGDYLAERLARAYVGVEDGPFIVFRRHRMVSWLGDQLMANRPYDEIARKMISAEGIWTSHPEVNFITVTVDQNDKEEGPDEKKLAGRLAKSFLGVRLDCVECHDDFLGGPWKQSDFHQLAAFFAQSEMSLTGVRDNPAKAYRYRYLRKSEDQAIIPKPPFNEHLLDEEGTLRQQLAAWTTHPENRPFARAIVNRIWALLFNQPLVKPLDSIPLSGDLPPALEILADDLIAHRFDLQRLIRVIAASRPFQLDSRAENGAHAVTEEQQEAFAAFPLSRLRPEQMAGSILQSAKLRSIDSDSHVFVRIVRFFEQGDFLKRYGDAGEDEFGALGGTIPQRLVLMNGKLVHERTKEDLVMNAATRIAAVSPDVPTAIETAYLSVLSRRPTAEEQAHFAASAGAEEKGQRAKRMTDLYWTLINSTEFSWNH